MNRQQAETVRDFIEARLPLGVVMLFLSEPPTRCEYPGKLVGLDPRDVSRSRGGNALRLELFNQTGLWFRIWTVAPGLVAVVEEQKFTADEPQP